jgi:hypothetical protein
MTTALALVQIILPLLPSIETGAVQLWNFINSVRSAAQQSAEWTPALEQAYLAALAATKTDPAYQPDK